MDIKNRLEEITQTPLDKCSDKKIYLALANLIDELKDNKAQTASKKEALLYISGISYRKAPCVKPHQSGCL